MLFCISLHNSVSLCKTLQDSAKLCITLFFVYFDRKLQKVIYEVQR